MLSTLNVSQTGLNAAKIAVENVSNNIANESTAGYKKRVVQLSELDQMDSQFTGRGVSANSAYRITSQYMYDKLVSENTKSNYYSKLSNMMSNVESIFAETKDSGLSADLNRYYQAIENLRTNPNSQVYKTTLQNQGSIVVESLQNLYTSVEEQQQTEKKELYVNVDDANNILKQIGVINEKIEKYGETNDLLDKRDQLELDLSSYADIKVSTSEGSYELTLGGQTAISNNTNVRTLTVVEEDNLQKDKYTLVDGSVKPNVVYDALKYNEDFTPKTIDANDVVTYKLNNEFEVSVTMGESLTADWDNDVNTADTTQVIDQNNLTRALVFKINSDANMKDSIVAYNGDYTIDANGNKTTNNKYQVYLDKLDAFAQTLADISDKYIKTGTNSYIYGEAATNESLGNINSTGLFSGSGVKTLKFDKTAVNDLTQEKLDYLATIQWKTDLSFEGKGQKIDSSNKTSLGDFFRDLRVSVSSDKENIEFANTTQANISMSIRSTYDQLTKVDKDEEMLNLIKFQAAYTANAKMITVIDEMLQTLLGLKR